MLRALIELDYEAMESYQAAIERIGEQADRSQLLGFLEDHRRHVAELSSVLRHAGLEPPSPPQRRRVLNKSRVVIDHLLGGDKSVEGMKGREERRHRAWLEARISAMTPSTRW